MAVDRRWLQGNSEGWQNLPSGTVLSLTLLARNLWETRIFLGSVFHGHGWVAALNDSEKFSLWVSWYNYTVSMGRKTYRFKTKFSVTKDVQYHIFIQWLSPFHAFCLAKFHYLDFATPQSCVLDINCPHWLPNTCVYWYLGCDCEDACWIGLHIHPHSLI